jgi:hypothetical protein
MWTETKNCSGWVATSYLVNYYQLILHDTNDLKRAEGRTRQSSCCPKTGYTYSNLFIFNQKRDKMEDLKSNKSTEGEGHEVSTSCEGKQH